MRVTDLSRCQVRGIFRVSSSGNYIGKGVVTEGCTYDVPDVCMFASAKKGVHWLTGYYKLETTSTYV
jgi:hypothetical protein